MKYFNNILETIGNTPLIKLNKITKSLNSDVFVKVESFNPGNSVKDRMAVKMIEDAEKEGKINSGGTIVEGTSGNTGMGLALAAIVKGYKLICVSNDKQSKEKFDVLRAMGAKVIVCPTNVEASDPRSYYSVSKRISEETDTKPKPMVLLDDKPIIWHLMSIYAAQGFDEFIIDTYRQSQGCCR